MTEHAEARVGVAHRSSASYEPEAVRAQVREALRAAGFGARNGDAPLCDVIEPGMTVLVKPNWVLHRNLGGHGEECLVTHPAFIEAVLRELEPAKPGRVLIADSPVLFCNFDRLVPPSWRARVASELAMPVEVIDLRRTVARGDRHAEDEGVGMKRGVDRELRPLERYALFDLGAQSLLEPVSHPPGRFRLNDYDPDELCRKHRPGVHQYLLCKEAFEADVVLSLPKLKTHHKAGMTGALKSLVGLNGNKDYLPHHRAGGSLLGGDSYEGLSVPLELSERLLDAANRRINQPAYAPLRRAADAARGVARRIGDAQMCGEWHGNDTTWRMALDLDRILLHGRPDGTLANERQRPFLSLTDAIVAGQGDGPLAPRPLPLGVVTCAASPAFADTVHAALLGFDPERLPIVRNAFGRYAYPITERPRSELRVQLGEREHTLESLFDAAGRAAEPPHHWGGHVERAARTRPHESG